MERELKPRRVFVNPVYKDKVTILKSSEETGGLYSLGELEVSPGGGNQLHTHTAFDETFTAVRGVLGVAVKDEKLFLLPGDSYTVPKHTPHHFFNITNETVVCQVKFTPGHEGFEKGIAIAYGLAAEGKTNKKGIPKNLMYLALIIKLTDTSPIGLLKMLNPVFSWLAKKAKKNGMEDALLKKYYYRETQKKFELENV